VAIDKRVAGALAAFLLFFVLTNPGTAGPQVRVFIDWIGDLGSAIGVFLESLFSDTQTP
jgi:hypothetical protein